MGCWLSNHKEPSLDAGAHVTNWASLPAFVSPTLRDPIPLSGFCVCTCKHTSAHIRTQTCVHTHK